MLGLQEVGLCNKPLQNRLPFHPGSIPDLGPSSYPFHPGSIPDLGPSSHPFHPGSTLKIRFQQIFIIEPKDMFSSFFRCIHHSV